MENVYVAITLLVMISSSVCICNVVGGIKYILFFRGINGWIMCKRPCSK